MEGASPLDGYIKSSTHSIELKYDKNIIFTEFFKKSDRWWPEHHSLFGEKHPKVYFDLTEGGSWVELGNDGGTRQWGTIQLVIPETAVVATWQIDGSWNPTDLPEKASRILFLFEELHGVTKVSLSHFELNNHAEDGKIIKSAVSTPPPGQTLSAFKKYIDNEMGNSDNYE